MENNKTFEENLKELEEIVRSLEDKNISLEDAVNKYTKGLELSKICNNLLSSNEELIVKKMTESGLADFIRDNQ